MKRVNRGLRVSKLVRLEHGEPLPVSSSPKLESSSGENPDSLEPHRVPRLSLYRRKAISRKGIELREIITIRELR